MSYQDISSVNATNDLGVLLVYANTLTYGWFAPAILLSFFLIVFIGGIYAQKRFAGRENSEFVFAVAGFVTFGFAAMMSIEPGFLNPVYLWMSLGIAILGAAYLYFSAKAPEY